MRGAFFCFAAFVLMIAVFASLANHDYVAAFTLIPLGLGLPILYKASK